MKSNRVLALIIALIMMATIIPIGAIASDNDIGKEITMGIYNGNPIKWTCAGKDDAGYLFISNEIICEKSFDAASNNHSNEWSGIRQQYGSNNWKTSCIRKWLNSAGAIDWTNEVAIPSAENVSTGNGYDSETGFLSSFNEEELANISEVTNKSYLNELDFPLADGGNAEYDVNYVSLEAFVEDVPNHSNDFYQNTQDKVFLLGPEQIALAYSNLGKDFLVRDSSYWIRFPSNVGASYEVGMAIFPNGQVEAVDGGAYNGEIGVRPALYLSPLLFDEAQGAGDSGVDKDNGTDSQSKSGFVLPEDGLGFFNNSSYWDNGIKGNRNLPLSYYQLYLGKAKGKKLFDINDIDHGICYGMAALVALLNNGTLNVKDFHVAKASDINWSNDTDQVMGKHPVWDKSGNYVSDKDNSMVSALLLCQLFWLYQKTVGYQLNSANSMLEQITEKQRASNLPKMISRIKRDIDIGNYQPIGIYSFDMVGHGLVPISYEETKENLKIQVYDCSANIDEYLRRYIVFTKNHNGNYNDWYYDLCDDGSCRWEPENRSWLYYDSDATVKLLSWLGKGGYTIFPDGEGTIREDIDDFASNTYSRLIGVEHRRGVFYFGGKKLIEDEQLKHLVPIYSAGVQNTSFNEDQWYWATNDNFEYVTDKEGTISIVDDERAMEVFLPQNGKLIVDTPESGLTMSINNCEANTIQVEVATFNGDQEAIVCLEGLATSKVLINCLESGRIEVLGMSKGTIYENNAENSSAFTGDIIILRDDEGSAQIDRVVQTSDKNGIVKESSGKWAMYKNGKVDTSYTGIAKYQNGWWRVKDGYVDFNANGIYKNEYGWWKCTNGKVTFKETGIFKNEYGWWRVVNSKVDFKANSIYKNQFGWWKTTNGKVTFKETGVFKNEYGWWRVKDSKVDFSADGIYKNEYGWWKTTDGKVTFVEDGVFKNEYGWWKVDDSKVDFKFTGIAKNKYGTWYVKNGKVDFNKNGKVKFEGKTYTVKNGKVQ